MSEEPEYNRRLRVVIRVQKFLSGTLYVTGEVIQALLKEDITLAEHALTGAHVNFIERLKERVQSYRKGSPTVVPEYDRRSGEDRRTGRDRRATTVQMEALGAMTKSPPPPPRPTPAGTMKRVFDRVHDGVTKRSSQRLKQASESPTHYSETFEAPTRKRQDGKGKGD